MTAREKSAACPASGADVRFPGQYHDAETGQSYNYCRYSDREIGRYITPDPIGLGAGSTQLYGYVSDSPVMATDPRGKNPVGLLLVGAAIASAGYAAYEFYYSACKTAEHEHKSDKRLKEFLDGNYDIDVQKDQRETFKGIVKTSKKARNFAGSLDNVERANSAKRVIQIISDHP